MVDLTGVCDLCGRPGKLVSCARCGKRVCEKCRKGTVCKLCKDRLPGGGELAIPESAKPTTVNPGDYRK